MLWPLFNHKPALMRAYKAADRDGDGLVERREFRRLLHYLVYFNDLWDMFEEVRRPALAWPWLTDTQHSS